MQWSTVPYACAKASRDGRWIRPRDWALSEGPVLIHEHRAQYRSLHSGPIHLAGHYMQTVFSVTLPFPSLRMMRRMARTVVRAMTGASLSQRTAASVVGPARVFSGEIFSLQRRNFHARSRPRSLLFPGEIRGLVASLRRFRKLRRRQTKKRISNDKREVELSVKVCVEECLSRNSEVLVIYPDSLFCFSVINGQCSFGSLILLIGPHVLGRTLRNC